MLHNNDMCLFDLLDIVSVSSCLMHGKHVTIVDVGRVERIQNLIRYEANTGFSNAEKPVLKPNRKTGSSGFFHTGTQPYNRLSPGTIVHQTRRDRFQPFAKVSPGHRVA